MRLKLTFSSVPVDVDRISHVVRKLSAHLRSDPKFRVGMFLYNFDCYSGFYTEMKRVPLLGLADNTLLRYHRVFENNNSIGLIIVTKKLQCYACISEFEEVCLTRRHKMTDTSN